MSEGIVAGRVVEKPLLALQQAAFALIEEENMKVSPNNAMIDVLCDLVRLIREHSDYMQGGRGDNLRLIMEAQIHAQEATTANATINDIYQLISGSTGEPGNWHGAEPVREYIDNVQTQIRRIRKSAKAISDDINEGDKVLCHVGQISHACAVVFPLHLDGDA